jgi:DNA-binding NarL/FixJ family response regulator
VSEPDSEDPGPNPVPNPIVVVIIDDHRMFAESLSRLLSAEEDIDVRATVSTAAAVPRALADHQPRVVLLDNGLPDATGTDVARQIKQLAPETMVVMVTGSVDDQVLLAAIDAGCSGFMTKDRTLDEVAQTVRRAAAGEVVISPRLLARLLPQLKRARRGVGHDLSPREHEVLDLLSTGATNRAIAEQLQISFNTVRNHVQQILQKLGAHSKLEAVSIAVREGIITYPEG